MSGPDGDILSTRAYGWRLERRDGVTMAFTSHDRDVVVDGLLHRASPGLVPTSILQASGLETDGLEIEGNLDIQGVSEADLESGRWSAARLLIYLFDWQRPVEPVEILAAGELGETSWSGGAFRADMRGLAARLDRPVVPFTAPTCRARFCGEQCGLNAERFRHEVVIMAVAGERAEAESLPLSGQGRYAYGRARWLSGGNCGLWSDIVGEEAGVLILTVPPPFPVTGPVRAELYEGCDRLLATCSGRFGNAVNFRGEPFLPGNDLLTRYPGAG